MTRVRLGEGEVVDALYRGLLGRRPDAEGRRHHLEALASGQLDLGQMIHSLRWSPESATAWLRSPAAGRGAQLWAGRREHREEAPLYFLHIMKTAGTSLVNALEQAAGPRLCLTQLFLDYVPFLADPLLASSALLAGHLGVAVLPLLPPQTRVVTLLREPVSRVLSHYAHLCRDPAVSDRPADLSLEQFLRHPRWRPLASNFQARHLVHQVDLERAWVDFDPARGLAQLGDPFPAVDALPLQFQLDYGPLGLADHELRTRALARLDSLDLVGVTEGLDRFLSQVLAHWGLPPVVSAGRDNVGRTGLSPDTLTPSLREEILAANAVDLALYHRARDLAERGWKRP